MNRKGFIAMSLIYSFFIVFIVIIFSILSFYRESNVTEENLNKNTVRDYNSIEYCDNCTPKVQNYVKANIQDDRTLPVGSYVYLPLNNYDGLFMVYDATIRRTDENSSYVYGVVKLISEHSITVSSKNAAINLDQYQFDSLDAIESIFPSYTPNISSLPDYAKVNNFFHEENNVFGNGTTPGNGLASTTNPGLYNTLNDHMFFRINYYYNNTLYDGFIYPACSCGSNSYSSYLSSSISSSYNGLPSINTWSSSSCSGSNVSNVSTCNMRFLSLSNTNLSSNNIKYPIRLFVYLKYNAVITGGRGTKNNPYLVGVDI